ncbi:hypothetical protein SAMN05878482_11825 [Peribacillus simplex]|uniref:Uncharacterized protein n=1 Tax=Peribacillus simplex TaxID=1478 RepID=A0A9X8WNK9_9BACI|nr:hypothetical protein SAMN05878482_11825 [Peribacillus simplex]
MMSWFSSQIHFPTFVLFMYMVLQSKRFLILTVRGSIGLWTRYLMLTKQFIIK